MLHPTILVINPGSTSTRTALFRGEDAVAEERLACSPEQVAACDSIADQIPLRLRHVEAFLDRIGVRAAACDAIAARGGPVRPVPGGVYRVNAQLLSDARSDRFVAHVSRIACVIAHEIGSPHGVSSFVVDPVSTDEYDPVSRISGLKGVPRTSLVHALNLKAVARIHARETGRPYEELNLITAMLGGGCSIAIHARGRMVDSVDANGEGPFSPERSGGLRVDGLARMVLESGSDWRGIRATLTRRGGVMSHLGTTDVRDVLARIADGDEEAQLVMEAMTYGVSKHICGLAAAVEGRVDAIVLTGGLANAPWITDRITARVSFLAPVHVIPGEREMEALRDGVLRVLRGTEKPRIYPSGVEE
jgi:butyrate kinase